MNQHEFEKMLQEVDDSLRGKKKPARRSTVKEINVKALRQDVFNLSQESFALLIGISIRTLQNWEQKRRRPQGPARVLLRILERDPAVLLEQSASRRRAASVKYRVKSTKKRVTKIIHAKVKKSRSRVATTAKSQSAVLV